MMHRGTYLSTPLRVSGSIKLDGKTWRTRLRVSDPTRPCGYRDIRGTLGPAFTGKGEAPPGTFTRERPGVRMFSSRIMGGC